MVDKNLLRHYRFHGPSVAGAAEPTKAPAGAGRRVESPLGRSRFRDEVQASIDGITARKEQERERLRGRVAFHRDWLPRSVVPGPRGSGIALSEEGFLSVKRRRASGLLGEAYDIIGKYRITRAVDASRPATPV